MEFWHKYLIQYSFSQSEASLLSRWSRRSKRTNKKWSLISKISSKSKHLTCKSKISSISTRLLTVSSEVSSWSEISIKISTLSNHSQRHCYSSSRSRSLSTNKRKSWILLLFLLLFSLLRHFRHKIISTTWQNMSAAKISTRWWEISDFYQHKIASFTVQASSSFWNISMIIK